MNPLPITSFTLTTALGAGVQANWEKLRTFETGLAPCRFAGSEGLQTWVGEVAGVDQVKLPAHCSEFDCRNNRLAWLGLQQDGFQAAVQGAVERYGSDRVAVFMGTSTSGIHQTELAYQALSKGGDDNSNEQLPAWYRYENTHNTYSIAEFVRRALGLEGVCSAISTACSSSAKVFASANRALALDLCDAAVVGGVDSLCLTTLHGFNALQLVSTDICRPADSERVGLSIGEAAGYALLERAEVESSEVKSPEAKSSEVKSPRDEPLYLLGYGESSDAYHMSSPHPEGEGAVQAMSAALASAQCQSADVDYVNLHGTATPSNDLAESIALTRLFGEQLPCSSTKGWTGHTLGAAGIVEAIFSLLCVRNNFMPGSLNTRELDPAIRAKVLLQNVFQDQSVTNPVAKPVARVLSNSFGFGGSNCSLVLGQLPTGVPR